MKIWRRRTYLIPCKKMWNSFVATLINISTHFTTKLKSWVHEKDLLRYAQSHLPEKIAIAQSNRITAKRWATTDKGYCLKRSSRAVVAVRPESHKRMPNTVAFYIIITLIIRSNEQLATRVLPNLPTVKSKGTDTTFLHTVSHVNGFIVMGNGKLSGWLIRIFFKPTHLVYFMPDNSIQLKGRNYALGIFDWRDT